MPQFEVTICRTTVSTTKLSISASSEDEAATKAEDLISSPGWAANIHPDDWSLEAEDDEIESIDDTV